MREAGERGTKSHKVRRNGRLLIAPSSITLMKFSLSCLNTRSTTQLKESKQNNNESETTHRLNSREKLLNVRHNRLQTVVTQITEEKMYMYIIT